PAVRLHCLLTAACTPTSASGQPVCCTKSIQRYLTMEVTRVRTVWPEQIGRPSASREARRSLPPKLNVPPKFCGEILSSVSRRSLAPNFHECVPLIIEV